MSAAKSDTVQTSAEEPLYDVSGEYRAMRVAPDQAALASRQLANEVPVALEFNGEGYAVMMLTPSDLEDFAVGFALSERIIVRASEIARIDIREGTRGIGVARIHFFPAVLLDTGRAIAFAEERDYRLARDRGRRETRFPLGAVVIQPENRAAAKNARRSG